jgi:hypothetical protein
MGSLALRPGDSLTILLDGFVNRLQDSQFPSFLLFKLRGLDSYPGGTLTHCSCQPSLDAHISVPIPLRTMRRREMIASLIFGQLTLFDNCHPCRMLSRSFAVPLNRELLPLQAVVLGPVDHSLS